MRKPIYLFLLEVALWLPFTFFVWYYLAPVLTAPLALLLRLIFKGFSWVEDIEQHGYLLEVVTVIIPDIPVPAGQEAIFTFSVNPLIYGYGLPFLMALNFAVPGAAGEKLRKTGLAWLLILLPVQTFCVLFSILKVLVYNTEPGVTAQIVSSGWSREAIGLAYQFGNLILPSVTPVVVWVLTQRDYLLASAPRLAMFMENRQ